MAKPRLFIGASRENQSVAEALQQSLDHDAEVEIWDQGTFGASEYPLESLEGQLDSADFAVFVFCPDDLTMMRGEEKNTVRDNVVFELGLFIGRLSRKRTFIVSPRDTDLHLPSDLAGLTPLDYDASRPPDKLRAALGSAATSIRAAIRDLRQLPRPTGEIATQVAQVAADEGDDFPPGFFKAESDWHDKTYEHRYFVAVFTDHDDAAREIDRSFRASALCRDDETLAVWEARCDWVQIQAGNSRSVGRFRKKVDQYPANALLRDLLGRALKHYGNVEEARDTFAVAAEISTDLVLTSRAIERALGCDEEIPANELRKYQAVLMKTMGADSHPPDDVLSALRSIATRLGLDELARGIDEVRVRAEPDNISLRFELGLRDSNDRRHALSLHHYLAIPPGERNGTTWNNLGVTYSNLQLPGRAVEAYLMGSAKGETIADGNLAHKLVAAGFFDDAKRRAEGAIKVEGHHNNVVEALTAIQTAKEEEQQKEGEAQGTAKAERDHLLAIGGAGLTHETADFSGSWNTPDGLIVLAASPDGTWTGRGVKETEAPVGLGLMFSPVSGRRSISDVEYKLVRFGDVLEGTVSRVPRDDRPSSLLGLGIGSSDRKVVITPAGDAVTLAVAESGYETKNEIWSKASALPPESQNK